ncbi:Intradiol ring-cleavage dioxygenase [Aspergillus floccosus]
MVHLASTLVAGLAGLASVAFAHPGHDVKAEAAERAAFLKRAPLHARSLNQCADKLRARGYEKQNVARRAQIVENLRRSKGLQTHVTGELIRTNIVDGEPGVPLYLDIQMIDTNTCDPISDVYLDIWHCNSTGVYSGVVANGNGNSNDETNLDATFLRGLQKTDADGIAQFQSIFPGHYTGRATHIHVLAHALNVTTVNTNNTISGLYTAHSAHVGQLFFDQDLISTVEETTPYSANTQELTTNEEDSILAEEAEEIDPFVEYVFLGDSVADGIFAWISMGMDATENSEITPAAYYTEEGGVENENSGMGGGPGGGSGGPRPSGSGGFPAPSGF